MDKLFLDIGRGLSLSIKLIAAGYLLYIFHSGNRKSTLILALAWLSATVSIVFDIVSIHELNSIFEALFASLLFYGILRVIEEEAFCPIPTEFSYVASVPLVMTLYLIGITNLRNTSEWLMSIGIPYGLSGFYIFLAGVLTVSISRIYCKKATLLAISLMLYGIHDMDYPLLRPVEWFAPIGFVLGALFTFMASYSIIQFVRTERFQELLKKEESQKIEIETGVLIVDEDTYKRIKESLRDFEVLAFLRDISDVPEKWEAYFITHITGKDVKTISPTNLAKIAELANRYLRATAAVNKQGVIVIDCLEYLIMYNSFESIVKFLSSLRDFIILYNGSLLLVTNPSAWSKKEWALLKRLLK
ncbi:DUF835 domain-containing protein [Thermococcus sp. M39]|uniref:DUF835 domain-containing protein n=1 Tax=unclassified Thermococcus TaxID=2627626 RepID=UPI00143B911A|nr:MULTISPECIES: DUF835 domain-containing protein [unclassified Thermococcus]NJE07019.1 DUF835 domain-containing protein [Thermococcus sp. M39]NJE12919.1 DUF835 domain-containing protein [Thermococcus sp. LS2]